MPKKPPIDRKEKGSLVPAISREEDRLKSYLEEAAAEARRIVKTAGQEADAAQKGMREELPGFMERRRAELLAGSRERAQTLRAQLAAETEKLLKKARKNCGRAASLIVAEVWPGDLP